MLKYTFYPKIIHHPDASLLPKGFIFPRAYMEYVKQQEQEELYPWFFMCHIEDTGYYDRWTDILKRQYPDRQLVPFAKWDLTDDVACFEPSEYPQYPSIHWIHTFTRPGYEERGQCNTFDDWLEESIRDAEQYQKEDSDFYEDLAYELYDK